MNCFETRKQKEDDKLASISAKLHWNAFVANKMRCTFCHCVSGGCRASTTGCTAVFLFQAHHALPRKPVLPHKWASGGSSLGGFWGRLRRFSHPSCSNLKIKSYIHYELWSIKCEKNYKYFKYSILFTSIDLHCLTPPFPGSRRLPELWNIGNYNEVAVLCQLPLGFVLRLLQFVGIP